MINKTEKILFDAVKNQDDSMACSAVGLFAAPDTEFEPDAEVPNLNLCDENGFTLLHYAIRRGLCATVSRLLEKGAAVDVKDKNDNTPLILAMKELSARKIDDSDIYLAIRSDSFKIVEKLIEFNADINAKDSNISGGGYTCLHMAVSQNHYPALKALLTNQKDPAKCLEVTDGIGQTPLHLACLKGDIFIVNYLLDEVKADPNFQSPTLGYTSLHFAINGNQVKIIPLLFKAGADPSIGTKRDPRQTPLLMAQKMKNKEAATAIEGEMQKYTSLSQSIIALAKSTGSPIHTAQLLSLKKSEQQITDAEQKTLTCGHLQIIFEKMPSGSDWRLEVINKDITTNGKYSMIFSSKESIGKIQEYLEQNNLSEFIEFIENKGVTAKKISQYLQEETGAFVKTSKRS